MSGKRARELRVQAEAITGELLPNPVAKKLYKSMKKLYNEKN